MIKFIQYNAKRMKFVVLLEKAEEGGYNVTVPALDGCFTQGDTQKEALENAKEAISCYLEGLGGIYKQNCCDIRI
jgi:antitoxin HicB